MLPRGAGGHQEQERSVSAPGRMHPAWRSGGRPGSPRPQENWVAGIPGGDREVSKHERLEQSVHMLKGWRTSLVNWGNCRAKLVQALVKGCRLCQRDKFSLEDPGTPAVTAHCCVHSIQTSNS